MYKILATSNKMFKFILKIFIFLSIYFLNLKGSITTIYNFSDRKLNDAQKNVLKEERLLHSIDVLNNDLSIQAKFAFSSFINVKPTIKVLQSNLIVFFPNVKLGNINKNDVAQKFYDTGLVEEIEFANNKEEGLTLNIKFIKDKVFITSQSIQNFDENHVVLEVYRKDEFKDIYNLVNGPLFLSCNVR